MLSSSPPSLEPLPLDISNYLRSALLPGLSLSHTDLLASLSHYSIFPLVLTFLYCIFLLWRDVFTFLFLVFVFENIPGSISPSPLAIPNPYCTSNLNLQPP
ncbi:MAG: hypothetical protein A2007_04405 [Verrucomicrobia bacterium GWC2_42_7]|nr:MAG: hypothetical protein A2007_04405 [Verrucomicrobia bacterium GWC2_42_7]